MTSSSSPANENPAPELQETEAVQQPQPPQQEAEIARLNEELSKMRDQWIRAVAETDNIRKRSQRELEESSRYAVSGFAGDLVSVLENLKRASDSIPSNLREENSLLKTLGEGVDLTLNELLNIFQNRGIKRVDPQGQKFDHNLHQAVAQVESDQVQPGTVIQVVQAGYIIHDRLLRPAMVVVSKAMDAAKKVDTTA